MERIAGTRGRVDYGSASLSLALLFEILVVAFGSLMPLTAAGSWDEVWVALRAGLSLEIHPPLWATILERLLAFLPMGMLAYLHMDRRGSRALPAAVALTALVALAIEIVQAAVVGRHARLSDFALASVFGCTGAAIGWMIQSARARRSPQPDAGRAATGMGRGSDRMWRWGLAGFVALCNAAMLGILTTTHSGLAIAGWDCTYPLLIGNELTQERPWLGRIRGLALYDRPLEDDTIRQLSRLPMTAENSAARRQAGARIIYAFDAADGSRLPNLGPADASDGAATVEGTATWATAEAAIDIRRPLLIRSDTPPQELCKHILRSRSVAVEIELASADISQGGPARIVSISTDTLQRDLTLGQENGALDLRVRTPRRGPNGMSLPIRTADNAITGDWQHVLATYSNGQPQIFVDGRPAVATTDAHKVLLFNEEKIVPVAQIAGVLYVAAGAAAAVLLAGMGFATLLFLGFSAVAAAPLAYAVALEAWQGYAVDWAHFGTAVAAPCLGAVLGWAVVRRCHRPHPGTGPSDADGHDAAASRSGAAAHG